jgi:hypothetical protein
MTDEQLLYVFDEAIKYIGVKPSRQKKTRWFLIGYLFHRPGLYRNEVHRAQRIQMADIPLYFPPKTLSFFDGEIRCRITEKYVVIKSATFYCKFDIHNILYLRRDLLRAWKEQDQ